MAPDAVLQGLVTGQQLGGYLAHVQNPIEKFLLRCGERQQAGKKITAVLDKPLPKLILPDIFAPCGP